MGMRIRLGKARHAQTQRKESTLQLLTHSTRTPIKTLRGIGQNFDNHLVVTFDVACGQAWRIG